MAVQLFKDLSLDQHYNEQGYAVFQLLNDSEKGQLIDLYSEVKDKLYFHEGIHITASMAEYDFRHMIGERIRSVIAEAIDRIFVDPLVYQGSFLIKKGNCSTNPIQLHQDWTFVNEADGFSSGSLWIALSHVGQEQGGISVLPGSHLYSTHYRYTPISTWLSPFKDHREELLTNSVPVDLEPGQAILWDHRLLHASTPNVSNEDRLVAGVAITSDRADVHLHYTNPNTPEEVGIYKVDAEIYEQYNAPDLEAIFSKKEFPKGIEQIAKYNIEENKQQMDWDKIQNTLHATETAVEHDQPDQGLLSRLTGWLFK